MIKIVYITLVIVSNMVDQGRIILQNWGLCNLSICFGCGATGKQTNLVHEIVDDLTFDAGDVITSTQLPNKENTESKICDENI